MRQQQYYSLDYLVKLGILISMWLSSSHPAALKEMADVTETNTYLLKKNL